MSSRTTSLAGPATGPSGAAGIHTPERGRGRPRESRVDEAVFDATLGLLAEVGYGALSFEAVARAAHVGRPSIYRRWPTKAALVVGTLGAVAGTDSTPDTGSLEGDLLALISSMASLYDTPLSRRVVPGLLGDLAHQPELAERFRAGYVEPRRHSARAALERASKRGEIPAVADPELVCDLIAGPLLLRAFVLGRPTTAADVAGHVGALLGALGVGERPVAPVPPAAREPQ